MAYLVRAGISLESGLLARFDRIIHRKGYKVRKDQGVESLEAGLAVLSMSRAA